jgi:ABC-type amino acid transport system permease subunit
MTLTTGPDTRPEAIKAVPVRHPGRWAAVVVIAVIVAMVVSSVVTNPNWAGILSVDEGQTEAASALGMSRMLTLRRIVLPQAMRVVVPPTGNETISMLKTTSLVSAVPYYELFFQSSSIGSRTFQVFPTLIMASLVLGDDQRPHDGAVLHRAVLRAGRGADPAADTVPAPEGEAREEW